MEKDSLEDLSENFYDVILLSHIIEHIRNGIDVIKTLCQKLKPGGYIYIEYPSVKSLGLPIAKHTLNFCTDSTHIKIYTLPEIANVLMENGCRIIKGKTRRDPVRLLLFPVALIINFFYFLINGQLHGIGLWDIMGFAEYVYAEKI